MVETSLQVIDAFIDGERVDPNALKAALAESAGRDYFVDVWLMREAVHGEGAADATPPVAPAAVLPRRQPRRWMMPAAAAIAGALIGGYAAGYRTPGGVASPSRATVFESDAWTLASTFRTTWGSLYRSGPRGPRGSLGGHGGDVTASH